MKLDKHGTIEAKFYIIINGEIPIWPFELTQLWMFYESCQTVKNWVAYNNKQR